MWEWSLICSQHRHFNSVTFPTAKCTACALGNPWLKEKKRNKQGSVTRLFISHAVSQILPYRRKNFFFSFFFKDNPTMSRGISRRNLMVMPVQCRHWGTSLYFCPRYGWGSCQPLTLFYKRVYWSGSEVFRNIFSLLLPLTSTRSQEQQPSPNFDQHEPQLWSQQINLSQ